MAQIANWITSPPLNVSRIKFLLHSPPSYFLSPLIPPSGQIQRPKSQPGLVLSLSPHPHHLTSHGSLLILPPLFPTASGPVLPLCFILNGDSRVPAFGFLFNVSSTCCRSNHPQMSNIISLLKAHQWLTLNCRLTFRGRLARRAFHDLALNAYRHLSAVSSFPSLPPLTRSTY